LAGTSALLVEIEKGTPWLGRVVAPFPSAIGPHITPANLQTAMEAFDIDLHGLGANYISVLSDLGTDPVQEATRGYLDTVCMHWNRITQKIDIAEVVIARYF
jgi:hypothetical protein